MFAFEIKNNEKNEYALGYIYPSEEEARNASVAYIKATLCVACGCIGE
jgi:hypothetical protein